MRGNIGAEIDVIKPALPAQTSRSDCYSLRFRSFAHFIPCRVAFPNDLHAYARAVDRVWTVSNGSSSTLTAYEIVLGEISPNARADARAGRLNVSDDFPVFHRLREPLSYRGPGVRETFFPPAGFP